MGLKCLMMGFKANLPCHTGRFSLAESRPERRRFGTYVTLLANQSSWISIDVHLVGTSGRLYHSN